MFCLDWRDTKYMDFPPNVFWNATFLKPRPQNIRTDLDLPNNTITMPKRQKVRRLRSDVARSFVVLEHYQPCQNPPPIPPPPPPKGKAIPVCARAPRQPIHPVGIELLAPVRHSSPPLRLLRAHPHPLRHAGMHVRRGDIRQRRHHAAPDEARRRSHHGRADD